MAHEVPIRDRNGAIIGLQGTDGPPRFTAVLEDSLAAVGATPPPPTDAPPVASAQRPAIPLALVLLALALLGLALLALLRSTFSPVATTPTPTASTVAPSALPASPIAALPRMVVAYAAPGGAVLGAIPAPTSAVARYGSDWAQVAHEGGMVWVRSGDVADLTITALPDLAPPPTATPAPQPVPIAPAAPETEPHLAAPCDAATALFHVRSPVLGPNGEPYGSVDGISCVSLAEAEHNAQVLARQVLDNVTATALSQGR